MFISEALILTTFFLCWGSFLNVVAYRSIHGTDIVFKPSSCPHCGHRLAWYDLIPVASWLLLKGSCRYCSEKISPLYPFIEIITAASLYALFKQVPFAYFFSYALFFSALIVSIRSDLEDMLICSYATVWLIPVGFTLSILGLLPISPFASIMGALAGYALLYFPARLYTYCTSKEGIGEGDFDLLAFIGSFIGITGAWFTLMCASTIGSILGIVWILATRQSYTTKIPFGPFLAGSAIMYVLFSQKILTLIGL